VLLVGAVGVEPTTFAL